MKTREPRYYCTVLFQDCEGMPYRVGGEQLRAAEAVELIKEAPSRYSVTEWYGVGDDDDEIVQSLNGQEWMDELNRFPCSLSCVLPALVALAVCVCLTGCTVVPTEDCTITVHEAGLQLWTLLGEIPPAVLMQIGLSAFCLVSLYGLHVWSWKRGYRSCWRDQADFLNATAQEFEHQHHRD